MSEDTVVRFQKPSAVRDALTELLREGAQRLLKQAVEAELTEFLAAHSEKRDEQGRAGVVRNGYLPEREVLTGIGPVAVRVPKVRSRSEEPVVFRSHLVPPYVRKAKSIEAALPWLYLRGISTGKMQEALAVLVGEQAKGLSAPVVSRLKQQWQDKRSIGAGASGGSMPIAGCTGGSMASTAGCGVKMSGCVPWW